MVNTIKEDFAKFCESPDRAKFRELLKNNTGEYNHIDFKEKWMDKDKLAKHILGFANAGGGVLVIGVKEEQDGSLIPIGLTEFTDKTVIQSQQTNYIPSELTYSIHDFDYDSSVEWKSITNKKFQVLMVESIPEHLPFLSLKSSGETLHKNRVYYRGKTNTEEATNEELKKIINIRLDTNLSTTSEDSFKEHLTQLKLLYSFLSRYYTQTPLWVSGVARSLAVMHGTQVENSNYPKEDFEQFIINAITKKKDIIESRMRF